MANKFKDFWDAKINKSIKKITKSSDFDYKGHKVKFDQYDYDEDGGWQREDVYIDGQKINDSSVNSGDINSRIAAIKSYIDRYFKSRTEKIIRHEGSEWILYSHKGKVLGKHPSKESAETQERAVEANKSQIFKDRLADVLSELEDVYRQFGNDKELLIRVAMEEGYDRTTAGSIVSDFLRKFGKSRKTAEQLKPGDKFKDNMGNECEVSRIKIDGKEVSVYTKDGGLENFDITDPIDVINKEVNVDYAGPVPTSLLAEQDLEGATSEDMRLVESKLDLSKSFETNATFISKEINRPLGYVKAMINYLVQKKTAGESGKSFADTWKELVN